VHLNRTESQIIRSDSYQHDIFFHHFPKIFRYDGLPETLSSDLLLHAKAIGQVDKKFVAFNISGTGLEDDNEKMKAMIVLADQHAIDERIVLEKMFRNLMDISTPSSSDTDMSAAGSILLSPPRKIDLSPTEVIKAMQYRTFFAKWNIAYFDAHEYQDETQDDTRAYIGESTHFRKLHSSSRYFKRNTQQGTNHDGIFIFKIPRIISDRCATNPSILKQIICEHISWLESQSSSQEPIDGYESRDNVEFWNRRLRDCPRMIIDILKSKACRNAIMFNDALSTNECQKLIDLLSECVFPFQCAHGR
jgi:DNA mismatch repair protein MLH3